jgi:hypothetical protein
MNHPASALQNFNAADVFIIHGLMLLSLLGAYLGGYFVAAKRWPEVTQNPKPIIDLCIATPVGIFVVWLLIPRIGLAGDKLISSYTLGNPNLITSFFYVLRY